MKVGTNWGGVSYINNKKGSAQTGDEGENGQIQSWHANVDSQGSELANLKIM